MEEGQSSQGQPGVRRAHVSKDQPRRLPYALLVSRFLGSVLDEVRPGGAALGRFKFGNSRRSSLRKQRLLYLSYLRRA